MAIRRIIRHLMTTRWRVRRAFPSASLDAIATVIKNSEAVHGGEIFFVVEGALENGPLFARQSARERAIDVFSRLRVWDTEHNNGVLVYLLLADHDIEIIADRGIAKRVEQQVWQTICAKMECALGQESYTEAVLEGIHAITEHLVEHFPQRDKPNQLPNQPILL